MGRERSERSEVINIYRAPIIKIKTPLVLGAIIWRKLIERELNKEIERIVLTGKA